MQTTSHQEQDFDASIKAIKKLLDGDVSVVPYLYERYKFIAKESCRYTYYKVSTRVPYEDVEQQAHLELVSILTNRVPHSGKDWLYGVNKNKGYDVCLGMQPYLITSVKKMLKLFVIERSGVIRVHKVIFEKGHIEKHGDPNPPKCISNIAQHEDEDFQIPGSVPVEYTQPVDNAIANEIREALCLTELEDRILELRLDGWTVANIAEETGMTYGTMFRTIQNIQARYARWRKRNG